MSTKHTSYHYPQDEFVIDHEAVVVEPDEGLYTTHQPDEGDGLHSVDPEESLQDDRISMRAAQMQDDAMGLGAGKKSRGFSSQFTVVWDKWRTSTRRFKIMTVVVVALLVMLPLFRLLHHTAAPVATPVISKPVEHTELTAQQLADQQNSKWLDLKTQMVGDEVVISQLQNQVQQIQTALTQAMSSNEQLGKKVAELTTQLSVLNEMVQKNNQARPAVDAAPQITYQLRAVVPGRAWIEDNNGNSLTVQVGDALSSYGRVEQINDQAGFIVTSSGRVIKFVASAN